MSITYTNPVYDAYMADPFVLRHGGRYYAYGTSPRSSHGQFFRVLESSDLHHWENRGWSLLPPSGANDCWAPEVACFDGVFYMYYSAQGIDNRDHHLRVATSATPIGPFEDAGKILVPDQPFTIDAHPFQDEDGQRFLFYSRDFLTLDGNYRVGTGIVVDKMIDPFTLAGNPQVVVRPFAEWQLFKAARSMYGATFDWYTIEGAAVLRHHGHYYCFYSGGAWERENYGVSYVVAEHPLGPYRLPKMAEQPLLRSVPGHVIGPGHNSFVIGPDGRQLYIVYHAWNMTMTDRLMRIDRVNWSGDEPVLDGPTWTPQTILTTIPSSETK